MKKQIIIRGFIGALLGIVIGYFNTIGISLLFGKGTYFSCVPDLIDAVGSETGAVIVQTLLDILLGITFGAASVIWSIDAWSIAKQTLLYLFITLPVMLFVAYFAYFMYFMLLCYIGIGMTGSSIWIHYLSTIFIAIFFFIWLMQYVFWKIRIRKLNGRLNNKA